MNLALTWAEGPTLNSIGLRAWANSLNKAPGVDAAETRIVILSPVAVSIPGAENIVKKPHGVCPAHRRWFAYTDVIRAMPDCDHVMVADCRDLVFQADPFGILTTDSEVQIVVVSEQQKTCGHNWCLTKARAFARMTGTVPQHSQIEINGGLQLGTRAGMTLLAAAMECFLLGRPENNIDQAFLNWWIYNRCPVPWKFAPDYWYIHGESVKTRKQKIEIHDDGLAYFKLSPDSSQLATVWHQYDRVPGHEAIALAPYLPTPKPLNDAGILFIVAHFNEPLNWLSQFFPYQSLVISKNGKHPPNAVARPNIGFEAETWAWFFAQHYDELPEIMVCLQGNPFGHIRPDMFQQILQRLQTETNFSYIPISTPGHKGWTGTDTPDHHGLPMRDWWGRLFRSPPPLGWYTPYGGQFAVHRDAVRQRPREYWQMIRDNCKTRNDACTLERLWQFILTGLP